MDTSDKIYNSLLEKIRTGELGALNKLPSERALSEKFSTSRAQVKKAISRLAENNIVVKKHGAGVFVFENVSRMIECLDADVRPQNLSSLADQIEARLLFEPSICRMAAENISETDKARLKKMLDKLLLEALWFDFKTDIYQFFRILYEAAGNQFMLTCFENIIKQRNLHSFDGLKSKSLVSIIVKKNMHQKLHNIYAAVIVNDGDRAESESKHFLVNLITSIHC